jgi:hypothetical protein
MLHRRKMMAYRELVQLPSEHEQKGDVGSARERTGR